MKPVHLTKAAQRDLRDALFYFADVSSERLANRFEADVASAFARIQAHPDAGSPKLSNELAIVGLRAWHLKAFNRWVIYYLNESTSISVVRILHGSQDAESALFDD